MKKKINQLLNFLIVYFLTMFFIFDWVSIAMTIIWAICQRHNETDILPSTIESFYIVCCLCAFINIPLLIMKLIVNFKIFFKELHCFINGDE